MASQGVGGDMEETLGIIVVKLVLVVMVVKLVMVVIVVKLVMVVSLKGLCTLEM